MGSSTSSLPGAGDIVWGQEVIAKLRDSDLDKVVWEIIPSPKADTFLQAVRMFGTPGNYLPPVLDP